MNIYNITSSSGEKFQFFNKHGVPENIHTPQRRDKNFLGGGGSLRQKQLKKCVKLHSNFQRGGNFWEKTPFLCRGMDIFCNNTMLNKLVMTFKYLSSAKWGRLVKLFLLKCIVESL